MRDLELAVLQRIKRAAAALADAVVDLNGPHDTTEIAEAVSDGFESTGLKFSPNPTERKDVASRVAALGRAARIALGDAGLDVELSDEHIEAAIWQFLEFEDQQDWTALEISMALSRGEIPIWCPAPRVTEGLSQLESEGRVVRRSQRDNEVTWRVGRRIHPPMEG